MPGWAIVVIVILIVALVIGAVAGLTLTQPWSKIVVFVNNLYHDNEIGIYVDGKLVSVATIGYEQNIDFQGVYGVKPGTHTVGAEVAGVNGLTGSIGYMDTVKLGPFDTMEVWLEVG